MSTYRAYAKINLFLHVNGKTPEGYHNLQSLVGFSSVYDDIRVSFIPSTVPSQIEISGDFSIGVPNDSTNIALKAFNLLKEKLYIPYNIDIHIRKNIPFGAGLGGGSSDASIILQHVYKHLNPNTNYNDLRCNLLNLSKLLGADVPVCLYQPNIVFVEDIGIPTFSVLNSNKIPTILINPCIVVPTKDIFDNLTPNSFTSPIKITISDINTIDKLLIYLKNCSNSLESTTFKLFPEVYKCLTFLQNTSPVIARMSGSGSTCFAIYKTQKHANDALTSLKNTIPPHWWIQQSYINCP